jgi:hypothetical protein
VRILTRRHDEHDAADASEPERAAREADLRRARVRAARGHSRWQELDPVDLVKRGLAHVIALHFGHQDGGELVRKLYGHPDAAIAREQVRDAFMRAPAPPVPIAASGR